MIESIKRFQNFINYDLTAYIKRYYSFFKETNNFNSLVSYWTGKKDKIDPSILGEFHWLIDNYNISLSEIQKDLDKHHDYNIEDFEFIDFFSTMKLLLDYIENLPKYLRTSLNKVDIFDIPVQDYVIGDGETFETISTRCFGVPDFADKIMALNGLRYFNVDDEDWVGRKISIPLKNAFGLQTPIAGIIDGNVGKNTLGRDIKTIFTFADDDIVTVDFEDCFVQSILNLLKEIPRGSMPENPNFGNTVANIIGKNVGLLSIHLIKNDLQEIISAEPTLKEMKINNVELKDDAFILSLDFTSVVDNVFYKTDFDYKKMFDY